MGERVKMSGRVFYPTSPTVALFAFREARPIIEGDDFPATIMAGVGVVPSDCIDQAVFSFLFHNPSPFPFLTAARAVCSKDLFVGYTAIVLPIEGGILVECFLQFGFTVGLHLFMDPSGMLISYIPAEGDSFASRKISDFHLHFSFLGLPTGRGEKRVISVSIFH